MKNTKLVLPVLLLMAVSLSCKLLDRATSKNASGPPIDFVTFGKGLNVTVEIDKKQTASRLIPRSGGSLSLTAKDGSKFTLDVPGDALAADTTITMTAVMSLDGAALDNNTPTAVQLEPSGLFFKEMATLTIVPAREIPIQQQVIFGYERDGKDYHLALVDPKSKEIKVMLMRFSGAGVGSGSASAAAANLMMQASTSEIRLRQIIGEYLQDRRQKAILEGELDPEMGETIESAMDKYETEVINKKIVAAGIDCKHARSAMQDILSLGRQRQLLGMQPDPDMWEKIDKLAKIAAKCLVFRVSGESNQVSFSGEICGLDKPFVINATFPGGGSAKTSFTPGSATSGATKMSGGGAGCVQTGGGNYTVTIKEDGSGSITWTDNATLTCPGFSTTKTNTFTLPLQPAPEISCP
jgi:hypothetical protein